MSNVGSAVRRVLDWVNRWSVTGAGSREVSDDDVRRLYEAQRADEGNRDRQVWVHGSLNGRH